MQRNLTKSCTLLLMVFTLSSCASSYKSTWDCPKVRGIGCSSVEYADMIALEQIKQKYSAKYKLPTNCCNSCNKNHEMEAK